MSLPWGYRTSRGSSPAVRSSALCAWSGASLQTASCSDCLQSLRAWPGPTGTCDLPLDSSFGTTDLQHVSHPILHLPTEGATQPLIPQRRLGLALIPSLGRSRLGPSGLAWNSWDVVCCSSSTETAPRSLCFGHSPSPI